LWRLRAYSAPGFPRPAIRRGVSVIVGDQSPHPKQE
jgi:hypothetical protein